MDVFTSFARDKWRYFQGVCLWDAATSYSNHSQLRSEGIKGVRSTCDIDFTHSAVIFWFAYRERRHPYWPVSMQSDHDSSAWRVVVWRAFPSCQDWIKCLISKSRFSPDAIANVQRQQSGICDSSLFYIRMHTCILEQGCHDSIFSLNKGSERTVQN